MTDEIWYYAMLSGNRWNLSIDFGLKGNSNKYAPKVLINVKVIYWELHYVIKSIIWYLGKCDQ